MMPAVQVAHHVEGRTRLKVAPALAQDGFLDRVARELAEVPGVDALHVHRRTGSIVIEHEAPLSAVAEAARKRGLFAVDGAEEPATAPRAERRARSSGLSLGALTFFGLGLYQAFRGDVLPAAVPLLMQGWTMLHTAPNPGPAGRD